MSKTVSLSLLQKVLDSQKTMTTIFQDGELIVANSAFLSFFDVVDIEEFNQFFRHFYECFVPHPSYFNQENINEGEYWYDSIAKFDKERQIVSIVAAGYEPHAFSVEVSEIVDASVVVSFDDITQSLIQRIMIENNATTDTQSGAYCKKYFLHVATSYDDAAMFNKKIIGITKCYINQAGCLETELRDLVEKIKENIREDDMLVRWSEEVLMLIYLIDEPHKVELINSKLKLLHPKDVKVSSYTQMEGENIAALLKRVG